MASTRRPARDSTVSTATAHSPWRLVLDADGTIRASGSATAVVARTPGIRWSTGSDELPMFGPPSPPTPCAIAGEPGLVRTQHATMANAILKRSVFLSADGRTLAVRLTVENRSTAPLRLAELEPFRMDGDDGLRIAGTGADAWHVTRMSRHKNDVPGCFRPLQRDLFWAQAQIDGAEFSAGMGSTTAERVAVGRDPDSVPSDPGFCVRATTDPRASVLLLAVLGQTEHLNRVVLSATPDRSGLRTIRVLCEFDDVVLPPGAKRGTHWVVLREGLDEYALWTWHAETLARELGVPHPKPPPTVFCSWYFYGRDFTEADLSENLAELRRRPTPFDTLLLDNGWMDCFGDWNAHPVRFQSGMRAVADAIRAAGHTPGIWTCPFVLSPRSAVVARHPRLVLRDADGVPCTFPYREPDFSEDLFVLDPTAPEAEPYLTDVFRRLAQDGFRVHKLDFLRAVVVPLRPRFHDASATRAQAYRRGMEIIRAAVGRDAYVLACGGLFEGSAGLVDGNRIGSDVKGRWSEPDGKPGHLLRIQQNVYRNYGNRLWHTDPDALQLRRRTEPFRERQGYAHLSDGKFTDDEAFACAANQYIGGGLVCFSDRMAELDEDRRMLLRRIVPPAAPPAIPLDAGSPGVPSLFLTRVQPKATDLPPWWTLTVFNWNDTPVEREVALEVPARAARIVVFELADQAWLGVRSAGAAVRVRVPAHGARVLRIAEWDGASPVLLGTDGHLSGGAAEVSELVVDAAGVRGVIDTPWHLPIVLTFGRPADSGFRLCRVNVPGPGPFRHAWQTL